MAQGNGQQQRPGTALALMAQRLAVAPGELEQTLKQTAFKGASDAEFMALVLVANKYDLDPIMREIYAFPKKGGGIVPLVPIDGWLKLIREHDDFAGMDVRWADEMVKPAPQAKECPKWVEVTIHHKSHPDNPTVHREYIDEMYRSTGPWNDTTKRMLEWKGIIQAGRIAFGLSGIKDQDEAERISDGEIIDGSATEVQLLGEDGWSSLLSSAADFGFTEDDVLGNAAAYGHEGPGPEMPRDVGVQLFRAMKQAAEDAVAAAQGEEVEGELVDEQPLDTQTLHDAQREQAAAAERSPSQMAADLAQQAKAREQAKPITGRDVTWITTQATVHGIGDDELYQWVIDEIGVEQLEDIPALRLGDVKAWIGSREVASGSAAQ